FPFLSLRIRHHCEIHNSGARNEDVDGTKLVVGCAYECFDLCLVRHICLPDDNFTFTDDKSTFDRFEGVEASGTEGYVDTFSGQGGSNSSSNSGRCSHHDGYAAT